MSVPKLSKLIAQRQKLTALIHDETLKTFPVGSSLHWMLGNHVQGGTVLMVSWERIKVCNSLTGKEFWVNLHRVLSADWRVG